MTRLIAATLAAATLTVAAVAWSSGSAHAGGWETPPMAWNNVVQSRAQLGGGGSSATIAQPQNSGATNSQFSGNGTVDSADYVKWQGGHGN